MELSQLKVMLTVIITLLVTGIACLPFEQRTSPSFFILIFALIMCVVLGIVVAITVYVKARRDDDEL